MMRPTPEKPRTVPSVPGRATMREPFRSSMRRADSSAIAIGSPSLFLKSVTFLNSSCDWRREGLRRSTRDFGWNTTSWSAMAAVTVLLPLWREHSRSVRSALDLRSRTCHGSGGIAACSMIAAGSRRSSRFRASTRKPLHCFRDGQLRLRVILESRLDRDGDERPLLRIHDADRSRVLELGRLRPAGLAVSLPSRTEAEPAERLIPSDFDLGCEACLRPGRTDLADEGEVRLPLLSLTGPHPELEGLSVDAVRFGCDPVEGTGPDCSDDSRAALGGEESRASHQGTSVADCERSSRLRRTL